MTFNQKLEKAVSKSSSCLCVGLDPNIERIPGQLTKAYPKAEELVFHFLKEVIDVTAEHCAAYKPNLGFFEALGANGLRVFKKVIDYIPAEKIIIADAKRGDISSTAEHYSKAYFEQFKVDAVTLNPLIGWETLDPFLDYPEKGLYVLTLTSNPGADDFLTKPFSGHASTAEYIADTLAACDEKHATHVGMVIGATQPDKVAAVLENHRDAALLIPGIGTQGGSIKKMAAVLKDHKGIPLFNSSRSILYAGQHTDNWQQATKDQALEFKRTLKPITEQYA